MGIDNQELPEHQGELLDPAKDLGKPEKKRVLEFSKLEGFPFESFPLSENERQTLELLVGGNDGSSVLIYSKTPETGRTTLAVSLAQSVGKKAYFLDQDQFMLDRQGLQKEFRDLQDHLNPQEHVLVFDNDDELLHSLKRISDCLPRSWLVQYLKENRLPIIWIIEHVEQVPFSTLRLFDYVLELKEPEKKTFVWTDQVPPAWKEELKEFEVLDCQDIEKGLGTWKKTVSPWEPEDSKKSRLIGILKQKLDLACPKKESLLAPMSPNLSEDLWNTNIPLKTVEEGLAKYLDWLPNHRDQRQPYAILCSGVPGSGKSQYIKYLAKLHNMTLRVYRSSDIVFSHVGDTEKKIAEIFKDPKDNEILLFEEVDSLLTSRTLSNFTWEITSVNEFLAQLESYPGVVACSTNYLEKLDEAVARRFVVKVSFGPLKEDQIPKAWNIYFPNLKYPEVDTNRLLGLCPGDFKTVSLKNQFSSRDMTIQEVLQSLLLEKKTKERLSNESTRKIGFTVNG